MGLPNQLRLNWCHKKEDKLIVEGMKKAFGNYMYFSNKLRDLIRGKLMNAFVMSRLNYYNSLFMSLPNKKNP